jgi:hypothetical protein
VLTEKEIGSILAAQLTAMIRNREQSYVSSVGAQYSHLEAPGKKIMAELVDMMFVKAVECDAQRKKDEAHQLVMDNLKK